MCAVCHAHQCRADYISQASSCRAIFLCLAEGFLSVLACRTNTQCGAKPRYKRRLTLAKLWSRRRRVLEAACCRDSQPAPLLLHPPPPRHHFILSALSFQCCSKHSQAKYLARPQSMEYFKGNKQSSLCKFRD